LGVIVQGVPQGASGQYIAGKNELTVAMSIAPDGKKTVLACADRAIFDCGNEPSLVFRKLCSTVSLSVARTPVVKERVRKIVNAKRI